MFIHCYRIIPIISSPQASIINEVQKYVAVNNNNTK